MALMRYDVQLAKDTKVLISGSSYIVERKWDGMRCLFQISKEGTEIFSRQRKDLRERFPELLGLHTRLGNLPEGGYVLDGEIVAMISDDQECLETLQDHRKRQVTCEVKFFDVLEVDGQRATSLPLWQRRGLLMQILEGTEFDVPELLPHGEDVPAHWEGVVSKSSESPYLEKSRSNWYKWKFVNSATLLVTGLTKGKGARSMSFGAITVSDANGIPRGQVGSGFNAVSISEIEGLAAAGDPIFIEVEYRFLSGKSGLMVNTAYKGVRHDKSEADAL